MRRQFLALATGLLASAIPASAETPLSGAEFDAEVTGSTLTYDYGDGLFGTEEYLPNREVRWAFEGETCMYGKWYEAGDQICFIYRQDPAPQCWNYFLEDGAIRGRYMGDGGGWDILESGRTTRPLSCAGPDVGV